MAGTDALLTAPAATTSAPAVGTPAAAPLAAGAPAPVGSGTPAANASWYGEHVPATNPELKTWADGKKFTSMTDALTAYQNAEKLIGGDPKLLLRLPAEGDAEAQGSMWNKLGRPEKAEGYKLGEELKADPAVAAFLPAAWAAGLTQGQVEGVLKWSGEMAAKQTADAEVAFAAQMTKSNAELKAEWGQGYDRNIAAANATIQRLGLTDVQLSAMAKAEGSSSKSVIQQLAKAGEGLVEGKTANGQGAPATGFGNLTPQEAKAQWDAMSKDPAFVARMKRNDPLALQQKRELDAARRGITVADFQQGLQ